MKLISDPNAAIALIPAGCSMTLLTGKTDPKIDEMNKQIRLEEDKAKARSLTNSDKK
jgi:hypothetical protein